MFVCLFVFLFEWSGQIYIRCLLLSDFHGKGWSAKHLKMLTKPKITQTKY